MKYYSHINKTPLSVFVDCYVDDNLNSLIIDGPVEKNVLEKAWFDMRMQFSQATKNHSQVIYLNLLKETSVLSACVDAANDVIELMEYCYSPVLGKYLNKIIGARISWPEQNRQEINRSIKHAASYVKSMNLRLNIKSQELDKHKARIASGNDAKPTREYFDLLLNLIEEHFSVAVDYTILTSRFCDKITRMNKQNEKLNSRYARSK